MRKNRIIQNSFVSFMTKKNIFFQIVLTKIKKTSVNAIKNDKTKKKSFSDISSIEKNKNEKRFMNDKNVTKTTIFLNVLRFLKTFLNVIITNKMHLFKKRVTIF